MKRFPMCLGLILGLLAPAAFADEYRVGPVSVHLGMSTAEVRDSLPSDLKLYDLHPVQMPGENGESRVFAKIGSGNDEGMLMWVTFEHDRLVRASRLVGQVDYTNETVPTVTTAIAQALTEFQKGRGIEATAETFVEGKDRVSVVRFAQGDRSLQLTTSERMVQLVENYGREDVPVLTVGY